jgi:hypothetical protein
MIRPRLTAALLAATIAMTGAIGSLTTPGFAAKGDTIDSLAGRWTGTGLVTWKNGRQEPYTCVVTYYLTEGGMAVKQLLKCQDNRGNSETKLDLRTAMKVSGTTLTGRWEDRLYSLEGDVNGKVTSNGFEADASHPLFKARLEIAMTTACKQSVTIRPSRDIEVITATLSKC